MLVIDKLDIFELLAAIEFEEVFNIGVNPKLWRIEELAIGFDFFITAADLFFDAIDLVFVDMSIIDDIGHLAGFHAYALSNKMTEDSVLSDVERHTERDIVAADSNHHVKARLFAANFGYMPLGVPDTARQCSGWKPLILPERHNHTAVARVGFESFNKALGELIAFDNPAVGGANSVGIFFWIPFSALIFAVFGNFPFVPNFDATVMKPADVIALLLINPEHFEDGSFKGNEFSGENWEFFG